MRQPKVKITSISTTDIEHLRTLSIQTFIETFAKDNTIENIQQYLDTAFNKEQLEIELSNPHSEFYFAFVKEKLIGYLKLNHESAQTEIQGSKGLEVERIYIILEFYGQNAGKTLMDKAIERAREENKDFLWLGVWEKNERAIRFYEKHGFVPFDKHVFTLGDEKQTDIMMKLPIQ